MLNSDVVTELETRNRDGALQILGETGAGDGKTRVLVERTHSSKARAEGRHTGDTGAPVEAAAVWRGWGAGPTRALRAALAAAPSWAPGEPGLPPAPHLWLRPELGGRAGGDIGGERGEKSSLAFGTQKPALHCTQTGRRTSGQI